VALFYSSAPPECVFNAARTQHTKGRGGQQYEITDGVFYFIYNNGLLFCAIAAA
jgi:hypothetical protein